MDCTTIGVADPTGTPPMVAVTVFRRGLKIKGWSVAGW
jgi:hypothetical protein